MRWIRIQEMDAGRQIVSPSNGANCFTSVQRFMDATSLRELEREEAANRAAANPKLDPNEGDQLPDQQLHYHGLYFDFDCDSEKLGLSLEDALDRSRGDAIKLIEWFFTAFPDLNPAHVQCWFSGRKGFHVMVRPEVFGIKPHRHLTYILKNAANQLKNELGLDTLDASVYTIPRMWRIPNTVNPKSGRFKIELFVEELKKLSAQEIMKMARHPRNEVGAKVAIPLSHLWGKDEYKEIVADEVATAWWQEFVNLYDIHVDMRRLRPMRPIIRPKDGSKLPACMKDLLENGPKETGPNRNRVLLPMVGFFVDAGTERKEAHRIVKQWTEQFYPEPRKVRERVANGRTVVESGYRGGLQFSCRAIRGNSGKGTDERVACVGYENCPWIQDPSDQNPQETPTVHLSEATRGCYMNTKIRMPVHVAAIAGHPFDLPLKGRVVCGKDAGEKLCGRCPVLEADGKFNFKFDAGDEKVLELINVNKSQRKGTIKAKVGVPEKCFKHKLEILEHSNLEEVQLIPMVDFAQVYMSEVDDSDDETAKSYRHVVRRGFHLGHGIKANNKYMVEASVFAHPKDQRVCFLFDKAEPAQNDIDQFTMTPEKLRNLKVFQRRKGQSVEQKLLEIHRDFTANVHQIGGRMDLSVAIDLCYHSVIGFNFLGKFVNKGWFELLVCGDTGTGKTTMIERLMSHFGLGELIAGEDSKRTGLVYASIQMQGQWILRWGKIPQNDRRLLVIDEFAGIPQEEVAKMTQLRSEGRARGGGVNADYETWARTRLILLTNPANNRGKMAGFNYGIKAIEALFKESQDLRRTDLAIIADAKEVDSKLINKRWDRTDLSHYYTADLCRNLVLWAWSREPKHVEWQKGAEDAVLMWADRLGDVYDCDIALAQRSDLRLKIARISAAVAARLFSTDEEAKKVLVEIEHVEFAAKFMDRCYRKPSMAYFEHARKYKQDNYFTKEKKEKIKEHILGFSDVDDIISTLLDVELITKPTLSDMVNLEENEFKRFWKWLVGNRLVQRNTKGYRKSEAFTEFLKALGSKKSGYSGELSDDFETGGDFGNDIPDPMPEDDGRVVKLFPEPETPQHDPEPVFDNYSSDEDDSPFFDDEVLEEDDEAGGDDPPF